MEKNKKKSKKVKVIKVTSTYYQGADDTFELHSIDVDPWKEVTEKTEEYKANPDDILEVGFSDGASKNQKYQNLIIRSGLQLIDNQQILQVYDKWLFGTSQEYKQEIRISFKYSLLLEKVNDKAKNEVLTLHQQHYPTNEISSLCHVDNVTWR